MTPPVFSVIMPVWNRATIVTRAIRSVMEQDFSRFELIIVDDGSTDKLEEAVFPFLGDIVHLFHTPHRGVGAARNYGLRMAKGEFIAYLDSDNSWHPSFLSGMYSALTHRGRKQSAAYCRYNHYIKMPIFQIPWNRQIRGKPFCFEDLLVENYIDINTFVHARDCIAMVGYWDEHLKRLVDWDYIMRITAQYEPVFIPDVLVNYYYRAFDNSISNREELDPALAAVRKKIFS